MGPQTQLMITLRAAFWTSGSTNISPSASPSRMLKQWCDTFGKTITMVTIIEITYHVACDHLFVHMSYTVHFFKIGQVILEMWQIPISWPGITLKPGVHILGPFTIWPNSRDRLYIAETETNLLSQCDWVKVTLSKQHYRKLSGFLTPRSPL